VQALFCVIAVSTCYVECSVILQPLEATDKPCEWNTLPCKETWWTWHEYWINTYM